MKRSFFLLIIGIALAIAACEPYMPASDSDGIEVFQLYGSGPGLRPADMITPSSGPELLILATSLNPMEPSPYIISTAGSQRQSPD